MLLFSLTKLSSAYSLQCASPLEHADPVPGSTLRSVLLVTRHGMRTPIEQWMSSEKVGYWTCSSDSSYSPKIFSTSNNGFKRRYENTHNDDTLPYPPSCIVGELTLDGMRQHYELGKFYRNYLVDEMKFLPVHINTSLINLRSSHVERCIKSMQSFMSGFYPPETPGERLNITTSSDTREPLAPAASQCAEMSDMRTEWKKSESFQKRMNQAKEVYGKVFDSLNVKWGDETWMMLGDLFSSYYCAGQDIPDNVTDEMFDLAVQDFGWSAYQYYAFRHGVASGSIWRIAFRDLDRVVNGQTDEKFFFYSSHDITIAALLESLGYTEDILPPFRSHCTIELWQKDNKEMEVRVVFNGKIIPIGDSKATTMKYSAFKTMLSEFVAKSCIDELP